MNLPAVFRLIACALLFAAGYVVAADQPATERYRGSKVEWTRLRTGQKYWNRHSEHDARLLGLMRAHTTLNIDDQWRPTHPGNLEELCNYPFVYADNIIFLKDDESRNLAEFLRRGGFLLIDACVNIDINKSPDAFLKGQLQVLARQFGELRVETLTPEHEIFSIYFKMTKFPPQTRTFNNGNWADGPTLPLRAVYADNRMIAVISLNGFQCGWALTSNEENAVDVIQMVTNIYIYAMTRGAASAPSPAGKR